MPSAPARTRLPVSATERVERRRRWPTHFRPRSRKEKFAIGTAVSAVAALVVAGVVYTMTLPSTPPPPATGSEPGTVAARRARILVPTDNGRCREYTFNNENGAFGLAREVSCDESEAVAGGAAATSGGFEAFKQAFGKR